jgi:hypothetical protein
MLTLTLGGQSVPEKLELLFRKAHCYCLHLTIDSRMDWKCRHSMYRDDMHSIILVAQAVIKTVTVWYSVSKG